MKTTVALLLLLVATTPAVAADSVWWEGEAASGTNFPPRSAFSADTFAAGKASLLSGGSWLTNSGTRTGPEAFARWTVEVPADGEYSLWTRKFWKHGPFRWRFDEADWRTCGRDIGLCDGVTIRTHLGANWVYLGRVRLKKGPRAFEIRLLAGTGGNLTACFDCFFLTTGTFLPRGKLKPGERSPVTELGWWAVDPDADPFGDAALDLRSLNEKTAGACGFLRRRRDEIVAGTPEPIRFWGVNCGPGIVNLGREPVRYLARRLARSGVNCVRIHGPVFDKSAADPTTVDPVYLERLHFFIAAMKAEGIYTTLSFYFPLWFDLRESYGLGKHRGTPFALLFFDPRMQEIWRAWARALLTTKNPHTGLSAAKDPAVALVEIVNEDSVLFWTFKPGETIPLDRLERLEREFATYLLAIHGSAKKVDKALGGVRHERDRDGRRGFYDAWHMTGKSPHAKRASEQLRFLATKQREFYARTNKWLRSELGVKCLISASNWKTAAPHVLDALERWTYTGTDVIDRHGYFSGMHRGEGSHYSLRVGHEFRDRAAVLSIDETPAVGVGTMDFPDIVTEIGWPNPNRYRADFAPLVAALGSYHGTDGYFFFAVGGMGWDGSPAKFPVNIPTVLGQFPGCALLYRTAAVPEGPVAHLESVSPKALFRFKGTRFANAPCLDALRKDADRSDASVAGPGFRERVVQHFGPVSAPTVRADPPFQASADRFTLDVPRAVLVTGFLSRGKPFTARGFRIASKNEYGTVLVISLDGRPLEKSRRVLVQAVTEERPHGFASKDGRITSLGGYPMMVREIDAEIGVPDRFRRARVLDLHGYERGTIPVAMRFRFPRDALSVILE